MNAERPLAGMVRLALAAVLCAAPLGCRDSSAPTTPTADASLSPDEQVLQTLDCYNPEYKTDEDGRVTELRLVGQHLPPAAFAKIDKLTELQIMDLAWSTTTDEGLAQLKDLRKLRHLGLGGTPVTDRGLAYLEKMPSLERLWVAKGTISEAGLEKLREARPDMQIYGFE
jgi:hypothetical protein